jgi:HlyD family secretion protein
MTGRRIWGRMTLGVALLPVLLGGVTYWLWAQGSDSGKQAPRSGEPGRSAKSGKGAPVPVRVARPQPGGVERVVTRPASVHSFDHADLYAQVSGYLKKQVVDIGDVVKKGQQLAEIDAPELWARVQQAEADLEKARSAVEVAQARARGSEADLEQARTRAEQAETDVQKYTALVTLRKAEYRRIRALAEADAVQRELVDEKLEARRAAEADVAAATKAVLTAKSGVRAAAATLQEAKAKVIDARAQVKVAEAALTHARVMAGFTQILSPYDGVVTRRTFHPGDFVRDASRGGDLPLLSVARTDLMRVVLYVPDRDVPFTRRGEKARLVVDALPDRTFDGVVSRTAVSQDANTRTMRTEIDLPNPRDKTHPAGVLQNGMYGQATICLGKGTRGVTIPTTALVGDGEGGKRSVYVVKDGKAKRVGVQVGLDDGILAEVLSGLGPDDVVVVRHGPGLRGGVPVVAHETGSEELAEKSHEKAD